MKPHTQLALSALLLTLAAGPAAAQAKSAHPFRWYWGAQTGAFLYRTSAQGYYFDPVIGGHWLITKDRSALYIGVEEAFFTANATGSAVDTAGNGQTVSFSKVRRVFFGLLAYPLPGHIEPMFGGGLAMVTVVDAPGSVSNAANKANFWILGGVQINLGNLAVFGQYIASSSANNFLLTQEQHSVQGGVRYSFGSAREDVSTQH